MFFEEVSDDYLVVQYHERNQDAIELLFDRYTKFMYGIIKEIQQIRGEYIDFDDCFQESFLAFLLCLERYDGEAGNFYFFVKRTVERKLLDKFIKVKSNRYICLEQTIYEEGHETVSDYIAEDNQNVYGENFLYDELISRIDEDCKKIVDMKMEGYSYREIAVFLKITKQGIYRRVSKIKNILKDIIEKID